MVSCTPVIYIEWHRPGCSEEGGPIANCNCPKPKITDIVECASRETRCLQVCGHHPQIGEPVWLVRGTGLAPLRKARPWLAWCGHPVGSAVVQIANAPKVAQLPPACRPRPDHDPAMQRAHGAGCNEVVPTPRVANHRLRVCTPGAPRRGCTVRLRQVHPGRTAS